VRIGEANPTPVESGDAVARGRLLVLGDDQDISSDPDAFLGHAATVCTEASGTVEIRSSLTGFPPLFRYEGVEGVVVASTIDAIVRELDHPLTFDWHGTAEWIRIGVPIQHRTLFANVSVVPAGACLQIRGHGRLSNGAGWQPAGEAVFPTHGAYIEAQVDALGAAVERMDTASTFLSLTAGLDTRAVLAMLVRANRPLAAVTISGRNDSLDARCARDLCLALGLDHHIVRPDDVFFGSIDQHARESVRLSGGISGIEQALEVYTYRSGNGPRAARLTGNLGNQVGRSGTEGTGMRGLASMWFTPAMASAAAALPDAHWHTQIAAHDTLTARELMQQESLFASLGNASLGSALATQQTPYADRTVISNKLREPAPTVPRRGARARDLSHRFIGEPASISFQRRAIIGVGGPVAAIPINWGSVPTGGVSLAAMFRGLGAGVDAMLGKDHGVLRHLAPLRLLAGIQGLSGFRAEPLWRNPHAMSFILDTLRDAAAHEHPFFDVTALRRLLSTRSPADMTVAMQLLTLELARQEFADSRAAGPRSPRGAA
jgi:hypothetical protein